MFLCLIYHNFLLPSSNCSLFTILLNLIVDSLSVTADLTVVQLRIIGLKCHRFYSNNIPNIKHNAKKYYKKYYVTSIHK